MRWVVRANVVDRWWCGGGRRQWVVGFHPSSLGSSLRRWALACAAQSYPSFSSFTTMGGGQSSRRSLRRVVLPQLIPLWLFVSRFATPVFAAIAVVHVVVRLFCWPWGEGRSPLLGWICRRRVEFPVVRFDSCRCPLLAVAALDSAVVMLPTRRCPWRCR
jgi:hypothetical protein